MARVKSSSPPVSKFKPVPELKPVLEFVSLYESTFVSNGNFKNYTKYKFDYQTKPIN